MKLLTEVFDGWPNELTNEASTFRYDYQIGENCERELRNIWDLVDHLIEGFHETLN